MVRRTRNLDNLYYTTEGSCIAVAGSENQVQRWLVSWLSPNNNVAGRVVKLPVEEPRLSPKPKSPKRSIKSLETTLVPVLP
mmetsp:Transcript_15039/g.24910  ORF Transcript_15039/g.24910 Transcript_15039/m.24910 type:complete len:81 (+) Transcript_15039:836-1078(+)